MSRSGPTDLLFTHFVADAERDVLICPEGKELYNLRRETVEPVFGQIKSNMGFDRFLLKGHKGASAEAALMCMVHNVLKCVANANSRVYLAQAKAYQAATYLLLMLLFITVGRPARWRKSAGRPLSRYRSGFWDSL